jgi:DeoR/GlpR family transcriptional regulator of sugar metabolism
MKKKEERQKKIQYLLLEQIMFSVHELRDLLECSEATLRNDLRELESKGLVQRVYGGVTSTGNLNISHNDALKVHKLEKNSIAKYVVENILQNGQTIVLDIGTTNLTLAQHIFQSSLELNIVTNSLETVSILARNNNLNILMPGGEYDSFLDTFDTVDTLDFYKKIHADYYFMSCNGIDKQMGFTVPFQNIIATKSVIRNQVSYTIVLADSSKVGKIAFKKICNLTDVDMLIIDEKCPKNERGFLDNSGLTVKYSPIFHDELLY